MRGRWDIPIEMSLVWKDPPEEEEELCWLLPEVKDCKEGKEGSGRAREGYST